MKLPATLSAALLLGLGIGLALPATGAADDAEGEDDRVEVVEFFWYGCPHCHDFQEPLERWVEEDMPDDVEVRTVPALLSEDWEIHARAYYAAELMDELDRFHDAFYDAIHEDNRRLASVDGISEFAGEQGIDADEFADNMESFAVESRLREARDLNKEYGVRGTPTMGVGGDQSISPSDAGSFEEMLAEVERYIAEARDDD